MAGRPKKRQMMQKIEDRAAAAGLSLAEFVFDFIGDGKTMTHLAKELGYSRSYLSRHLNAIPEVQEALKGARLESADVMAEQTIIFSDTLANEADAPPIISTSPLVVVLAATSARATAYSLPSRVPERAGPMATSVQFPLALLKAGSVTQVLPALLEV